MVSISMLVMIALFMAMLPLAFAGGAKALPTCYITKGKKSLCINVSDLSKWEDEGWERSDGPGDGGGGGDGNVDTDDAALVAKIRKKADLIAFAEERDLPVELSEDDTLEDMKEVVLEALDADDDE